MLLSQNLYIRSGPLPQTFPSRSPRDENRSNMTAIFRNSRASSVSGEASSSRLRDTLPTLRGVARAPSEMTSGVSAMPGRGVRTMSMAAVGSSRDGDSAAAGPSTVILPGYSPRGSTVSSSGRAATLEIPSYEAVMEQITESFQEPVDRGSGTNRPNLTYDYMNDVQRVVSPFQEDNDDDDDPLVPRPLRELASPTLRPLRRATFSAPPSRPSTPPPHENEPLSTGPTAQLPLELPAPPASELPSYSAHLAHDELRLISTVHLDQNHPAAAFFGALTNAMTSGMSRAREVDQEAPITTGNKKLRVTLLRGAERMNSNGTGPIYARMGRGGTVSGRVSVGKVDHATRLEISVLGLVNTSYYVRGQYTLIDTMPLARVSQVLWPPMAAAPPVPVEQPDSATTAQSAGTTSTATTSNGTTSNGATPSVPPVLSTFVNGTKAKEPEVFLTPGTEYDFSLTMPTSHFRDQHTELPPTCQIFQTGMQAGIEYILRVKLTRKSWRLGETLGIPIIYEPRAYVPYRRLRILTFDDPLNPGWRTIRLTGGKPIKETEPETSSAGVEVTLLMPSPPILFLAPDIDPPAIPFHLNFHSEVTLPLATFSDPNESNFTVRLMRVTTMRIGAEREMRRVEIPCTAQVWQEGGDKITVTTDGTTTADPPRRFDSHSSTPAPEASQALTTPAITAPASVESSRPTSRRRSISDRRPSFFKRRSSVQPPTTPIPEDQETPTPAPATTIQPISESPEHLVVDLPTATPTPQMAPLPLGATDVHLFGTLQIPNRAEIVKRLIQSFNTPEISVAYVLEVAVQPKAGAVKEAFSHVWGGGLVEMVLGRRN